MISLSIVSHGQGELVQSLLDDLERLASPLVTQVIVTLNIHEAWRPRPSSLSSQILLLKNVSPKGFGTNHNIAFAHCDNPFFAALNPDLRLPDNVLPGLIASLETDAGLGLVSPRIVGSDGVEQDAVRVLITPWQVLQRRFSTVPPPPTPDWLAGMFMLFRSTVFAQLRGFDERYFMYCEDFDICARLRLAGHEFRSLHEVSVIHDARRATLKSNRHLRWHLQSLFRMWTSATFWRYRRLLKARSSTTPLAPAPPA